MRFDLNAFYAKRSVTWAASMFDPVKPFSDMFEPHGDGYVYFPSPKSGGKLITAAERDQLVANYRWWWAGFVGRALWIVFGAVLAAVLTIEAFGLPDATQTVITLMVAAAVIGGIIWSFNAPRRLVARRPDVVPPRSVAENRRIALDFLSWPLVLVVIAACSVILWSQLDEPEQSLGWWVWTIGSTAMLVAYLNIGLRKLRN